MFGNWFCKRHIAKIAKLDEEIEELKAEVVDYKEKAHVANLNLLEYIASCIEEKQKLQKQIDEAVEDASYFEDQANLFAKALAEAITIPDISAYIDTRRIVEPFLHPQLGAVNPVTHKMVYDLEVNDLKYYAFPLNRWLQILDPIRAEVKRILKPFVSEITDCDNWAGTMARITHHAIRKAGLDLQGAFFFAWSEGVHAYNGFVDADNKVWIYDPMFDDSLIGELCSTPKPMYDTTDIWFTG